MSLWLSIFWESLWTKFLQTKYFEWLSLVQWIRCGNKSQKGVSNFWNGRIDFFDICGNWLTWMPRNGRSIRLGEDPIIGGPLPFKLYRHLKFCLRAKGFTLWVIYNLFVDSCRHPTWMDYRLSTRSVWYFGCWMAKVYHWTTKRLYFHWCMCWWTKMVF